jgi:hypothetical protein
MAEVMPATLDDIKTQLTHIERVQVWKNATIIALCMAVVISASGWWFTSRDQTALERNGRVADCRAVALATTLDNFRIIVAPNTSDEDKEKAAVALEGHDDLQKQYDKCGEEEP